MSEGAPVRLTWATITHTGMRPSNQDALGQASHGPLDCFVIADGAGGHEGGEVASRIVVDSVLEKFAGAPVFGAGALLTYIGHAIANVAQGRLREPARKDMSATVAALLVDSAGARAAWAHLGDSRIYLFRGARVHTVSKDHSLTQQMIDAGYVSAAQLRTHAQRNILYAAVGAEGGTPVSASDGNVALAAGDAFLLCSDGLWEWVLETDMESTLAAAADSQQWLDAMCAIAATRSTPAGKVRDNYSAYAVWVERA